MTSGFSTHKPVFHSLKFAFVVSLEWGPCYSISLIELSVVLRF